MLQQDWGRKSTRSRKKEVEETDSHNWTTHTACMALTCSHTLIERWNDLNPMRRTSWEAISLQTAPAPPPIKFLCCSVQWAWSAQRVSPCMASTSTLPRRPPYLAPCWREHRPPPRASTASRDTNHPASERAEQVGHGRRHAQPLGHACPATSARRAVHLEPEQYFAAVPRAGRHEAVGVTAPLVAANDHIARNTRAVGEHVVQDVAPMSAGSTCVNRPAAVLGVGKANEIVHGTAWCLEPVRLRMCAGWLHETASGTYAATPRLDLSVAMPCIHCS